MHPTRNRPRTVTIRHATAATACALALTLAGCGQALQDAAGQLAGDHKEEPPVGIGVAAHEYRTITCGPRTVEPGSWRNTEGAGS